MKERLIGAVVLVLAAVIIIPVLLDGPQPDSTESRELALPAPTSETMRTHTVDLNDDNADDPAQVINSPPYRAAAVEPVVSAPAALAQPSTTAPIRPATVAPTRPTPVPAESATASAASDARGDGWAVQVGSFTSESNAKRLAELLKSSDYPAFVARNVINGRVMFRVRVGPEPDRLRAEALAERLRFDRQQTQLVRHP